MQGSARYRDAPPGVGEGIPLRLWVVAVLSLIWNAFGAFDYTMTNLRDPDYLADFPPDMLAVIDAMPLWAHAGWAVGVWGSLVGSILLLLRSHLAFGAFSASLAGLAANTIWQGMTVLPAWMHAPGMIAMNLAIWAILVGLVFYARRMSQRGILR